MRQLLIPALFTSLFGTPIALAGPVSTPWPVDGPDDTAAVAAAALSGWTAAADSFEDSVEIRWSDGRLIRTLSRARLTSLLPWMDLNGSEDGPGALALSDSGRLLFIAIHDANPAPDGQPSDAILRYDIDSDALSVFARVDLSGTDGPWTWGALSHYKGTLYVGVLGGIRVYRAAANDITGTFQFFAAGLAGVRVRGLAIDRDRDLLYAAWGNTLARAPITAGSLTFTTIGSAPAAITSLAYGDHYGGPANPGLYILDTAIVPESSRLWFIPPAQAQGTQPFSPVLYTSASDTWHDCIATADGSLLLGADEDAVTLRDSTDARLSFDAWTEDEFTQVVTFARSLITTGPGPGGGPAGWVIDADVQQGWTRFHPASPDGACWTILLLLMNDHINGDPLAQSQVRTILTRYAGLAPDGIRPLRSADGIFWHWIDPLTGGDSGWGDGYATMSTMKIVLAAARARAFYPDDAAIRAAADAIICGVSDWDAYFRASDKAMYLLGNPGGGPLLSSAGPGFHEGILFADQAGLLGDSGGEAARAYWLNRGNWPVGISLTGRPVTSQTFGQFLPAFVTLYPLLTIEDFRATPVWQTNIANLRASHAAWTDDNAPRFNTVFSAGTTKGEWGGYHADSLSSHPGDVTTFTSLLAMVAGDGGSGARTPEAVGAYQAYRRGARQTFLSGASILYRRSDADWAYQPDSAGLPDVALGALGLAELLEPGSVSAVLTGGYPSCNPCRADLNGDGQVDFADYLEFLNLYDAGDPAVDFNQDGQVDFADYLEFLNYYDAGC
ncbi:MAG: hypothetical protein IT436_17200 [Phycisphaerales bacterium]|nr:hypothetical protein [Phycisphaerales bacterium]